MRRRLAFVFLLLTACSADAVDPGPGWTGDPGCEAGTEGCPCFNGTYCIEPLICYEPSDVCIDPVDSGASAEGDSSTSTTADETSGTTGDGDSSSDTTNDSSTGDGDSSSDTTDSSSTGDGDSSSDTTDSSTGDGDGDSGDTGSAGTLDVLERCTDASECLDGLSCVQMTKSSSVTRCMPTCVSDAQCPVNTRCIDTGAGNRCVGSDIGANCGSATDCNSFCLTPQNYCTDSCSSGADCPNGYGCMGVGSPAQNVCVKLEALCDGTDNSACIADAACDLSPTLVLGGCTQACNTSADCPQRAAGLAPWTCDGLCRRPADVYGSLPGGWNPVEYHCDPGLNTVNLCNDAQHIDFVGFTIPAPPNADCFSNLTTTGAANDSCVNSCRYQGGCADDFSCVAVGSVGAGRIGLCLPSGNATTGQNCTDNTQCEFGYCVNGKCSRDCSLDGICTNGTSCVAGGGPTVEGLTFSRCE